MPHDTEHFKVREFACKHCGENKIDQRLIDMCEVIRQRLVVPVRVNSGYRCPTWNDDPRVGGVKNSTHTKGFAADLSCSLGAKKLLAAIQELDKEGRLPDLQFVKEYFRWIHIDCGGKRRNKYDLLRK